MSATTKKPKKPKQPWDNYRRVAVWLGLLLPLSILAYPLITGTAAFAGPGLRPVLASVLIACPVLSGAVTGSRFFAFYVGFTEHHRLTDELPGWDTSKLPAWQRISRSSALYAGLAGHRERAEATDDPAELAAGDAATGYTAGVSGPMGDWWWSSVVAAVSGGAAIAISVAITQAPSDPGFTGVWHAAGVIIFAAVLYLPIAFVVALGWCTGALVGTLVSSLLSMVVGMAVGLMRRRGRPISRQTN